MTEYAVGAHYDHRTNQFVVEGNFEVRFDDTKLYDEFMAGQKRLQEWIKERYGEALTQALEGGTITLFPEPITLKEKHSGEE